jgi:hypothetical protein
MGWMQLAAVRFQRRVSWKENIFWLSEKLSASQKPCYMKSVKVKITPVIKNQTSSENKWYGIKGVGPFNSGHRTYEINSRASRPGHFYPWRKKNNY